MNMTKNLGKKAKDIESGKEGIISCRGEYLYGCSRYGIVHFNDKNEKENLWLCDAKVEILSEDVDEVYKKVLDKKEFDEPLELGIEVKDEVTGFVGILTARNVDVFECDSYQITPKVNKNEYQDSEWLDVGRLSPTGKNTIKKEEVRTKTPGSCEIRTRW